MNAGILSCFFRVCNHLIQRFSVLLHPRHFHQKQGLRACCHPGIDDVNLRMREFLLQHGFCRYRRFQRGGQRARHGDADDVLACFEGRAECIHIILNGGQGGFGVALFLCHIAKIFL